MMRKLFVIGVVLLGVMFVAGAINVSASDKVNINRADAEELVKLKKIGPVIASRIVEYRTKNGPFKMPEDIMKVKGIGEKTFDLIKDIIVVK